MEAGTDLGSIEDLVARVAPPTAEKSRWTFRLPEAAGQREPNVSDLRFKRRRRTRRASHCLHEAKGPGAKQGSGARADIEYGEQEAQAFGAKGGRRRGGGMKAQRAFFYSPVSEISLILRTHRLVKPMEPPPTLFKRFACFRHSILFIHQQRRYQRSEDFYCHANCFSRYCFYHERHGFFRTTLILLTTNELNFSAYVTFFCFIPTIFIWMDLSSTTAPSTRLAELFSNYRPRLIRIALTLAPSSASPCFSGISKNCVLRTSCFCCNLFSSLTKKRILSTAVSLLHALPFNHSSLFIFLSPLHRSPAS